MEHKQRYFLRSEQVRSNAIEFIKGLPLPEDDKQRPLVVDVKPATRNLEQNAKFHAMCQDIANQCEFMGRKLTLEQWKVLLISGHSIATKEGVDIVPGLEGEFVNIRESSAQMTVKRMASLIEYVTAYGVGNGVHFNDRYGFWG
ncbi:recombination protein NinB [Pasteurellaceae bacterium USgator11]|nr:recombination protein NinB [Pasteurellaceae bacterium USgator41]TNG96456.1 recombination protein NinB [Pasteurellaceae bacterium UScroc12]TNH00462.1 recombination protein NinB [Pasteurellaceae bacterium UScroc31]TNH01707.1 recombination protein NinB [Pasteurellaceae bacterium USgator11]